MFFVCDDFYLNYSANSARHSRILFVLLPLFAVFIDFSSQPNQKVGGKNLFYSIEKGT